MQDDIAQSVVKELRTALMGEAVAPATDTAVAADVRQATNGRSDNPEAFQLYLQGKFHGERTTQADTDKAIDLYKRAIAIDPNFALAWAGMAHMHQVQAGFGFAPIDEGFERARDAAQHALRLAPNAPEGHISWAGAGASRLGLGGSGCLVPACAGARARRREGRARRGGPRADPRPFRLSGSS